MQEIFEHQTTVSFSHCDCDLRMGVPQVFQYCMDLAGAHAELLGNGLYSMMDRGLFWVAVKTKLRMFRRPALLEQITGITWPEPPGRIRQDRDYRILAGEELLIAGKTEWTILDTKNGGLHRPTDAIYPADLTFCREKSLEEPYHRFLTAFEEEPFAAYTVCSTDIDAGGHMNNTQYVRMLAGLFSTEQWRAMDPKEVELHYRASSYEGDRLLLRQHRTENALEIQAALEDGKVILLARIA